MTRTCRNQPGPASLAIMVGTSVIVLLGCWISVADLSTRANSIADCVAAGTPGPGPAPKGTPIANHEAPGSDLIILDSMLRQHARSMSLANDALQNAQDSQVRRLALRIAEGHAGEMQLLRSWRANWFPEAPPIDSGQSTPADAAWPGASCSGQHFDRAFLTLLRAELQSEIEEARSAVASASHVELRDFARSLIDIRTAEISIIDSLAAAS